ncbi:MAG: gamma-glutamyl-gamma-aminobutyrate hydrolase family protein [Candidatus Aminicenantales bacterium]
MKKVRPVKVAIIDNSINPSLYDPVLHWSSYLKVTWEAFRAPEGRFPDLQKDYTHLILTGSEASILERETWVEEEVRVIREAADKGLSLLGSCYGHQLLALALAGPSHVRRCAQPEIGWIEVEIREESHLLGSKGRAYSFSVHFDEVTNLSDPFVALASSAHCPIQAFGVKGKNIWGLQIHPEIDILTGRKLLRTFFPFHSRHSVLFEYALDSPPKDSGLIHHIVDNFVSFFP